MIVQRLRAIQEAHGFLPEKELEDLAAATGTPLYRIQEVASFFPHFRMEWNKPPYVLVQVCRDYTCHLRGGSKLTREKMLGQVARTGGKAVVVEGVSCLGRCDRAPVICVTRHDEHDKPHGPAVEGPKSLKTVIDATRTDPFFGMHGAHEMIYAGRPPANLLRIIQEIISGEQPQAPDLDAVYQPHANPPADPDRPTSRYQIDVYAHKPELEKYAAVRQFIAKHPTPVAPPERVDNKWVESNYPLLWELNKAGLLGMGGAGVPAFRKWFDVWTAAGDEKYIVCNGDESEPGTFKDREILLRMPHLTVEGVILAGLVTNATAGYIYIRHEYIEQIEAVRAEIAKAVAMGVCGENILKSGRSFTVDVFVSPGGYICGEQSALLEAMSDRRGQPRNRPPELATNGLRDKPTVVNNVETLSWTPACILNGGDWYATSSTGGLKGRRLFSISGDLVRPGVYEVPISTTLGELINDYCGGVPGGKGVMAIAPSGPSGGLIPPLIPVPAEDVLADRIRELWADRIADIEAKLKLAAREKKEKETNGGNAAKLTPAEMDALKPSIEAAQNAEVEKLRKENWDPYLSADRRFFDLLKVPLDLGVYRVQGKLTGLNTKRVMGLMLGAGLAVYADGTDILSQAVNFTEFFRNESCGKCVPCRLGSHKLAILGTDLIQLRKRSKLTDAQLEDGQNRIETMSEAMMASSICSLGQVAPNPLATALEHFRKDILAPLPAAPTAARPPSRPTAAGS